MYIQEDEGMHDAVLHGVPVLKELSPVHKSFPYRSTNEGYIMNLLKGMVSELDDGSSFVFTELIVVARQH